MTRRTPHLLVALLLAFAALAAVPSTAAAAVTDKDCGDFGSQAAAQSFFLDNGGSKSNDPHALDADGDGIACESNPCPCAAGEQLSGGGDSAGTEPEPQPAVVKQKARVVEVIDGDTVDVKLTPGRKVRVRLIGIDTPEVYGGTECGGRAASRSAKKILPRGTRVLLVSDPTQDLEDRYGRLLRYVMKKKTDVNRLQVKRGHAEVYVYGGKPFKRVSPYRLSQALAKKKELGLWGACT